MQITFETVGLAYKGVRVKVGVRFISNFIVCSVREIKSRKIKD